MGLEYVKVCGEGKGGWWVYVRRRRGMAICW